MVSHVAPEIDSSPGLPLRISLWAAQGLVSFVFIGAGLFKLTQPIAVLAQSIAWTADYPEWFVRCIALVDLAGGLGMLLPALTRIRPQLGVLAALGCAALQVTAMIFHVSRGEAKQIGLNIVLLGLSLFVLWGRSRRVPITPRF